MLCYVMLFCKEMGRIMLTAICLNYALQTKFLLTIINRVTFYIIGISFEMGWKIFWAKMHESV